MTRETFLEMAERHFAVDGMLAKGSFNMTNGSACSVGCFNHDLGNDPSDFAALAGFTGYPEWAHHFQEMLFERLPKPDNRMWHVQFAKKAESVTDWGAVLKASMIATLEIALPHDTSDRQVVQRSLDLYHRDNVTKEEWRAAADAAADAADAAADAAAAYAAYAAAAYAADAAAAYAYADAADAYAADAYAAARAAADAAVAAAAYAADAAAAYAYADAADAAYIKIRDAFLNA